MKTPPSRVIRSTACLAGIALGAHSVFGQSSPFPGVFPEDENAVVYMVNGQGPLAFDTDVRSSLEFGEDIRLGGGNRVLTEIQFAFRADFFSQVLGASVSVYELNGPDANGLYSPGAKIFDHAVDGLWARRGQKMAIAELGYDFKHTVPDNILVTVRFNNVAGSPDAAIVSREHSSAEGSTEPGYWERTGPGDDDWALRPLKGATGNDANFVITVRAAPIPEPHTVAMGLAGVAVLGLGMRRFLKVG